MRRKGTFNENCSINYQRNKCKGKHNVTICEGPRKPDPKTKKDCNPVLLRIQYLYAFANPDNETLTTLNESRHSTR